MPGVLVDTHPGSSSPSPVFPCLPSSVPVPSSCSPVPDFHLLRSPQCESPLADPSFQQQLYSMELAFSPPPSHPHSFSRNGLSRLSAGAPRSLIDPSVDESVMGSPYADINGSISIPYNSSSNSSGSYGACLSPSSCNSPSSAPVVGSPGGFSGSPVFSDAIIALQKFLPSNNDDDEAWPADACWPAMDAYSCDEFRMYEFKVRRCMRGRSHDWTECPFAHPGEKARRRDPRRFHYSGTACPDFRKGSCKRGDACEYSHGVFECWLHPARYRTQPCKDGKNCKRRVCFFAHTVEQLRVLPPSSSSASSSIGSPTASSKVPCYDGSPLRQALASGALSMDGFGEEGAYLASSPRVQALAGKKLMKANVLYGMPGHGVPSPTSTLTSHSTSSPPALSPPLSPSLSPPMSPAVPVGGWTRSLSLNSAVPAHRRHLDRLRSVPMISIPSSEDEDNSALQSTQAVQELLASLQALQLNRPRNEAQWSMGHERPQMVMGAASPSANQGHLYPQLYQLQDQGACSLSSSMSRSYPSSPAGYPSPSAGGLHMSLLSNATCDSGNGADDAALRVESGRSLRAKIYGKIGMENGVPGNNDAHPDLGWVNELLK